MAFGILQVQPAYHFFYIDHFQVFIVSAFSSTSRTYDFIIKFAAFSHCSEFQFNDQNGDPDVG
jgi:hypothetical protein